MPPPLLAFNQVRTKVNPPQGYATPWKAPPPHEKHHPPYGKCHPPWKVPPPWKMPPPWKVPPPYDAPPPPSWQQWSAFLLAREWVKNAKCEPAKCESFFTLWVWFLFSCRCLFTHWWNSLWRKGGGKRGSTIADDVGSLRCSEWLQNQKTVFVKLCEQLIWC